MLNAETIDAAVRRGIITGAQRDAMLALAATGTSTNETGDTPDEQLRLIGGGNDIFVTIGVLLFLAGGSFVMPAILGERLDWIFAIAAAVIWALAEIVTRQKRMRLSSTVLALLFMACAGYFVGRGAATQIDVAALQSNPLSIIAMRGEIGWLSLAAVAALILTAGIYFWRFSVPILAAVVAVALTALAFVQTTLFLYDGVTTGAVAIPTADQIPNVLRDALYMPLACGLVIFGIAVALDLHDRERRTVWSDCAFWLHVVSAPLLVHPLFIMATGQDVAFGEIEPGRDAVVALAVLILGFTYVALAIDRRSLLVPTLAYFGSLGVYSLVNDAANGAGIPPIALVLVAVGSLIILFGAGWQRIRRLVVATTLPQAALERLPPIMA